MASNGSHANEGAKTESSSLEKIKKQLSSSSSSGRYLLQGPLFKRSETLRNWNERWMILDPTSGRMEYKLKRNEATAKGSIYFDATSSITLSPVNFHGLPKYDGCCFYIGTPQKKDYFLCAETPNAAKAWVSTLHATQLVLRAHKEAVNSLSGNGNINTGTVQTVVAAANQTAMEASSEIESAMKISLRANLGFVPNINTNNSTAQLEDDLSVMKETLRVKDEELGQLAKDMRSRDATINELAQKLTETARAAQDAARAAQTLDEQRRLLFSQFEKIKLDSQTQLQSSFLKARECEERATVLNREKEAITKQKEAAEQEALMWRAELAKARDQRAVLEASVARAEERIRITETGAEEKVVEASRRLEGIRKERDELLALVHVLQSQFQRKEGMREEGSGGSSPLTKHVDKTDDGEDDVDKACLVTGEDDDEDDDDAVPQEDEIRIADVREISPREEDEEEVDVRVVGPAS